MKTICIILAAVLCILIGAECYLVNYGFKELTLGTKKTNEKILHELKLGKTFDTSKLNTLKYDDVTIESDDGLKLHGYYFNKFKNNKKTVIICHGYTTNHLIGLQYLDMLYKKGFNVLLVDERAHGQSEGKYVTYGMKEREDLKNWVSYVKKLNGKDSVVGLLGQSMGAATVLMYEGKYGGVDFVVADSPYSNGKRLMKYQFETCNMVPMFPTYFFVKEVMLNKCGFDMDKVSPIDDIKNCEIPTLFIHGTADQTVPCNMSREMYKAKKGNKNKLLIVDGAVHVEAHSKDKNLYEKTVDDFIDDVLVDKQNTLVAS